MPPENDVPIHDAARYYEQQFGDRVRNLAKPSARRPSPGGRGAGWVGGGTVFVVIYLVLRLVLALGRDTARPAPRFQPPPKVLFKKDEQNDMLFPPPHIRPRQEPGRQPFQLPPDIPEEGPRRQKRQ
jgi:hypothetical protein